MTYLISSHLISTDLTSSEPSGSVCAVKRLSWLWPHPGESPRQIKWGGQYGWGVRRGVPSQVGIRSGDTI